MPLAIEILESLSQKGHTLSQYVLGLRKINDGDTEVGVALVRKAADAGHAQACAQIGR